MNFYEFFFSNSLNIKFFCTAEIFKYPKLFNIGYIMVVIIYHINEDCFIFLYIQTSLLILYCLVN